MSMVSDFQSVPETKREEANIQLFFKDVRWKWEGHGPNKTLVGDNNIPDKQLHHLIKVMKEKHGIEFGDGEDHKTLRLGKVEDLQKLARITNFPGSSDYLQNGQGQS